MTTWSRNASTLSLTSSYRRLFNRRYLLGLAVVLMMAAPPAWAQTYDFGDAPDASAPGDRYPTLFANGGARHTIDATKPHLGYTPPDSEADGQPNATATGDGADEDGIHLTTALIRGEEASLRVRVTMGTDGSTPVYLDGWIDFNQDDGWSGADEHVIDSYSLNGGESSITFDVPPGASVGDTFARFRLSTASGGLLPTGDAADGEVEDYQMTIIASDWGDAPNSYKTLGVNNGPRHGITGPYMGAELPDAEADGQLDGDAGDGADGDDDNGRDDEDGVTFPSLIRGESATINVLTGGGNAFIDAWIDFNGENGFLDSGENIAESVPVSNGSNSLPTFTVPHSAAAGNTYARFRISTVFTGLDHNGLVEDGEVEDYEVEILGLDFGDAPDGAYPTLIASNGARHAVTGTQPWLGTNGPDVESDGHQSASANGDDTNGTDDEDGVVFTSDLVPGDSATVDVTAAGAGNLDAWIDFNDDGDWLDAGEQVFTSEVLSDGLNSLTFAVPGTAAPGATTVARFRYSTVGGLSPTGLAVDGEVEDLMVDIAPVADLAITKVIDVATAIPGSTRVTFTITATNNGPSDAIGASVTDAFGDDLVGVIWTCTASGNAACGQAGGTGDIDTTVDLPNGDGVTFTAQAWVAADALGVACASDRCLSNTAAIDVPTGTDDPSAGNNSATTATAVLEPEADLSIDKDDGLTQASPGDLGDYTIRITNPGPSSTSAVTVTDTFPTGKIEGAPTCSPTTTPCWDCEPAPSLDPIEVQEEGQSGVSGLEGASASVVSPDGKHVYVTGSIDSAVVVFARDLATGNLTWRQQHTDDVGGIDGIAGADALAISPDGSHLYVTGPSENKIALFSRNAGSGALTFVGSYAEGGGIDGLGGAGDIIVSPDGAHVYVAGTGEDKIATFERNGTSGVLTFVEAMGGVSVLGGVSGLALAPDGSSLYAAGPDDDTLTVLSRDHNPSSANFGRLGSGQNYEDGASTDGLSGVNAVSVSPDGRHVYVTADGDDNGVAVFDRSTTSGLLTWAQNIEDGDSGGVNGLDGANAVTVSPDGTMVFVAAPDNSAVAAFSRNTETTDPDFGHLTFVDWFTGPDYGETGAAATFDGLEEANSVSVSLDGAHVFATGKTSAKNASLVVFDLSTGAVCPDPDSGSGNLNHQALVPAHSWVEFTAHYRIRNDATGTIDNEASLAIDSPADLVDSNSSNDSDSDQTGVGLEVNIEVTKVAEVSDPIPGEGLDYTITVTNHGPQSIDGSLGHIAVSDLFPIYDGAGVMAGFDSASGISWTCSPNSGGLCINTSGTGNISAQVDLAVDGSVVLHAGGILDPWSVGTIENSATFTIPLQYSDADSSNDVGLDSRSVTPTADLAVLLSHLVPQDDFSIDPGDPFQYEILIHNSGPSAARGVLVQDIFPPQLENVSWACSANLGSQCNDLAGTGNIAATVDLAPGGSANLTVTATVKATAEGAIENIVTIDSGNAVDNQNANNSDRDVITLNAHADLAVTKDDGRTEAVPGQDITYTITVTNRGGDVYKDDVYRAQVQDLFALELQNVSWTCDPTPPIPGDLTFLQLNSLIGRLDGAADVAVSPDGAHVYAVGTLGDALVAFSRVTEQGANFGKLSSSPIDEEQRDVSDPDPEQWYLEHFDGPTAVAVSPDGHHVYVAAAQGNAVAVFSRDWAPSSDEYGTLEWVETLVDGNEGTEGLDGASDLVLSPDGAHLYVSGASDNALAVFERNDSTGRLTFVEAQVDGAGGVDGLGGVSALGFDPQGIHLYAAGTADDAIARFSRDTESGELTFEDVAVNGSGGITGLGGVAAVIVSHDGAQVYAAGAGDNALVTFQRDHDEESPLFGTLTFDVSLTDATIEGLTGVRSLALIHAEDNHSDTGEHLLAGGDPSGKLVIFRRNLTTGILSFQDVLREGQPFTPSELTVKGLEVVSSIAASPDGIHIYTTGDLDGALSVFERRQPDPAFAFVETEINGEDDGFGETVSNLAAPRSVAVSGDGQHLIATAFTDDALVVFHRDPELGTTPDTRGKHLAFVAAYTDGGDDALGQTIDGLAGANQVVFSNDSLFVYVSSEADNAVTVFERDPASGLLTFVETEKDGVDDAGDDGGQVNGLSGAIDVAVSPSGGGSSHVYVAGQYEASIAIFERDQADGSLSYLERVTNGVDSVQGLDGISSIAISPDGTHLYAVGRIDDAIAVFERNPADGSLTFLQVLRDGVGGEGLDQAMSVAISPDGAHLFVASINDDALAVFARDNDDTSDSFGRLTFLQAITDNSTLADKVVTGLDGARTVAVGKDGLRVFVGAEYDGALSVFGRVADSTSPDFGTLNLIETRIDGVDGVDGLNQVYGVAVSLADNSHVYVAGLGDNAVAAFEARSGSSCTPSGLGDIDDQVNIGWGGQVAYTVHATVAPWATGTLTNEVRVYPPSGTVDPDLIDNPIPQPGDNNYAVDVDTLAPKADLVLTKNDGTLSATAGQDLTYTVTVSNRGPSHAVGAQVLDTDLDPAAPLGHFADTQWSCVATGSGSLQLSQILKDGDTQDTLTIDGLAGASGVAVSSDGTTVYATGLVDDTVSVFDRDLSTGLLTYVATIHNGDDHAGNIVEGLGGASDVLTVDDGVIESVYVSGQVDDSVAVFTRNPIDGTLLFLHAVKDGYGGIEGLDQAVAIAASDDGANLYVAGSNDDAIAVFTRQANGSLSFLEVVNDSGFGLDGVSDLALTPDPDRYLYATGFNSGTVAVFSRSAADGSLVFVEKKGSGTSSYLGGAEAVALDFDADYVYVGGSIDGSVIVFSRDSGDGSLNLQQEIVAAVDGLTGLAGLTDLIVSDDGAHVYAAGQSADAVVLFGRDSNDGTLSAVETFRDGIGQVDGLDGVAALTLSPDGRHLYAAGISDDSLAVFDRPLDSACPTNGTGSIDELVNVAAGGRLVFTADVTVRSDTTGSPCPEPLDTGRSCVVNQATVNPGPSALFSDPEGDNNSDTDADYLGQRADLKITKVDQYAAFSGLMGADEVAIDPDLGTHLYLAGADDSAIAIFSRNPGDGTLGYIGHVDDDTDGVNGIGGVTGLVLSSNGRHLYAAGPVDNAVAAFERDPNTGLLTFIETEINGIGGAAGLLGATAVAVSPSEDDHLYVAGPNSNAIAVFGRDTDAESSIYGSLDFVASTQNGSDGVVDMVTPVSLAVTDEYLYCAAAGSNAIVVFERDTDSESPDFGGLSYLESHVDGSDGVDGLGGASSVALSADGEWLFVSGPESDAIAVFSRDLVSGELTFQAAVHQGDVQGDPGSETTVDGLGEVRTVSTRFENPNVIVFAAGLTETGSADAVSRFVWNPAEMTLSFDQIVSGETVNGLEGATGLAVADDFLYVAASTDNQLTVFSDNGNLTPVQDFVAGGGGIGPGESDPLQWVNYTITVENLGPSQVTGAIVTDLFPPEFEDVNWTCSVQLADGNDHHTSCQTPSGTGDLEENVDLAVGGSVVFTATGMLRPEVTGTLSNTATVETPEGLIDPDTTNNTDTDDDTLLTPHADLAITKTRLGSPTPGQDLTYVITVTNNGPSVALDNVVTDLLPEAFVDARWSCQAVPPPGLLEPTTSGGYGPLAGASSVTVTTDGEHLYAVGFTDHQLIAFERDSRTGSLTPVQTITDGVDGINGLGGAVDVLLSPDDSSLYVAGEHDDAVAVFERDPNNGELTFLEVHRDGIGVVNGLGGVRSLASSEDGLSLYAAGTADSAVAMFDRNASTGLLSYIGIVQQGVGGVGGLSGVTDVAVSHDGLHVYAAGPTDHAVTLFERHQGTGELTFVESVTNGDDHDAGTVSGLGGAAAITINADDDFVYVAGEIDDSVVVFGRDQSSGELSYLESHQDGVDGVAGIDGPLAMAVDSDDAQLYVAGAASNAIAVFARSTDGSLSFVDAFDVGDGFNGLTGVRDVATTQCGRHLYAAGPIDDTIVLLDRHLGSTCGVNGTGDLLDTIDLIPGGTATYTVLGHLIAGATGILVNTAEVTPGSAVVDPDQDNNQATTVDNEIQPVADLAITKTDGLTEIDAGEALTYQIEVVNNGPSDIYGATVTDFFPVFPTVNAGFLDQSVSWTCAATTALVPLESHIDSVGNAAGLEGASWVIASPDVDGPEGEPGGDHYYVTAKDADAISVFAVDSATGLSQQIQVLTDGEEIDGTTINGLAGASGVSFSPDGRHLYVAGATDNAVVVFGRETDPDASDFGELDLIEVHLDGAPFHGLVGATDTAVSPDGTNVYVVSKTSNSVMIYERDPISGSLTYLQSKFEGADDVPLLSLTGARDVVVSPEGAHLYVAAQDADAISRFVRDPNTGLLTFETVIRNLDILGSTTINGLDFVRSLALSPGGGFLYAASLSDDAIVAFARDRDDTSETFGELTFLEVYRDGENSIDGLDGATALHLSEDGSYLFAAGLNDDALAVFKRNWTDGSLTQIQVAVDEAPGTTELDGLAGVTVTPDNKYVLVVAANDDAMTVFERTSEGQCAPSGTLGALNELQESVDLMAGGSATFTIQGTVDPGARGTLFNEAAVTSPLPDPDLLNNIAIDNDTVITVFTDLGITKDDGLETAIAGLPLTYSIVVSNAGPALAYGVTVTDTLPPMLLGCTCTRSDEQPCAVDGTNTLVDTIDLGAGASLTYTIDCLLDPATAIPVTNTVTVEAENPGHDTNAANDQATDSDSVVAVSDLVISKDNGLDEVVPGTQVAYLVQIDNLGPSDLSLGRVTDQVPTVMESVSWTCVSTPGAACTAGPIMGDVLDDYSIPVGGSVAYTIQGLVNPAVLGTIANTAVAEILIDDGTPGVSPTDPNLANNVATDVDALTPVADINITKVDDVDPVVTGYPLNYTITVSNPTGPSWAHDVVVADTLPAGVTLVSTTGCAEDPIGIPGCTIGPIANGDTAQVSVAVTVDEGTLGSIVNHAAVVSTSDDPNPSDNATTEDTQVDPWANLSIEKSDSEDPIAAGTDLTYTITVSNPGPYDADDVVVTDSMPTGVTFVSSTGCAEDPAGLPTCSLGSIAAGGSASYTLTVTVDSYALGTITNDAGVVSAWLDPDLSDNNTFEDTEVTAESDLAVTKENGLPFVVPGWDITYTIVVANDGPSDAPAADVTDIIPPELLSVEWTCMPTGAAYCSDGTGNFLTDTVDIPAGESVTYSVDCTVDPFIDLTDPVTIENTVDVVVTGPGVDPNTANNTATDADPVEESDLLWGDGFESGDTSQWSDVVGDSKAGRFSSMGENDWTNRWNSPKIGGNDS